jgi:choline kinase
LIKVDHTTILDHQIDGLLRAGIDQIAIVVGYEKEQIIRHVHGRIGSWTRMITFIENPAFAITNNSYSRRIRETGFPLWSDRCRGSKEEEY